MSDSVSEASSSAAGGGNDARDTDWPQKVDRLLRFYRGDTDNADSPESLNSGGEVPRWERGKNNNFQNVSFESNDLEARQRHGTTSRSENRSSDGLSSTSSVLEDEHFVLGSRGVMDGFALLGYTWNILRIDQIVQLRQFPQVKVRRKSNIKGLLELYSFQYVYEIELAFVDNLELSLILCADTNKTPSNEIVRFNLMAQTLHRILREVILSSEELTMTKTEIGSRLDNLLVIYENDWETIGHRFRTRLLQLTDDDLETLPPPEEIFFLLKKYGHNRVIVGPPEEMHPLDIEDCDPSECMNRVGKDNELSSKHFRFKTRYPGVIIHNCIRCVVHQAWDVRSPGNILWVKETVGQIFERIGIYISGESKYNVGFINGTSNLTWDFPESLLPISNLQLYQRVFAEIHRDRTGIFSAPSVVHNLAELYGVLVNKSTNMKLDQTCKKYSNLKQQLKFIADSLDGRDYVLRVEGVWTGTAVDFISVDGTHLDRIEDLWNHSHNEFNKFLNLHEIFNRDNFVVMPVASFVQRCKIWILLLGNTLENVIRGVQSIKDCEGNFASLEENDILDVGDFKNAFFAEAFLSYLFRGKFGKFPKVFDKFKHTTPNFNVPEYPWKNVTIENGLLQVNYSMAAAMRTFFNKVGNVNTAHHDKLMKSFKMWKKTTTSSMDLLAQSSRPMIAALMDVFLYEVLRYELGLNIAIGPINHSNASLIQKLWSTDFTSVTTTHIISSARLSSRINKKDLASQLYVSVGLSVEHIDQEINFRQEGGFAHGFAKTAENEMNRNRTPLKLMLKNRVLYIVVPVINEVIKKQVAVEIYEMAFKYKYKKSIGTRNIASKVYMEALVSGLEAIPEEIRINTDMKHVFKEISKLLDDGNEIINRTFTEKLHLELQRSFRKVAESVVVDTSEEEDIIPLRKRLRKRRQQKRQQVTSTTKLPVDEFEAGSNITNDGLHSVAFESLGDPSFSSGLPVSPVAVMSPAQTPSEISPSRNPRLLDVGNFPCNPTRVSRHCNVPDVAQTTVAVARPVEKPNRLCDMSVQSTNESSTHIRNIALKSPKCVDVSPITSCTSNNVPNASTPKKTRSGRAYGTSRRPIILDESAILHQTREHSAITLQNTRPALQKKAYIRQTTSTSSNSTSKSSPDLLPGVMNGHCMSDRTLLRQPTVSDENLPQEDENVSRSVHGSRPFDPMNSARNTRHALQDRTNFRATQHSTSAASSSYSAIAKSCRNFGHSRLDRHVHDDFIPYLLSNPGTNTQELSTLQTLAIDRNTKHAMHDSTNRCTIMSTSASSTNVSEARDSNLTNQRFKKKHAPSNQQIAVEGSSSLNTHSRSLPAIIHGMRDFDQMTSNRNTKPALQDEMVTRCSYPSSSVFSSTTSTARKSQETCRRLGNPQLRKDTHASRILRKLDIVPDKTQGVDTRVAETQVMMDNSDTSRTSDGSIKSLRKTHFAMQTSSFMDDGNLSSSIASSVYTNNSNRNRQQKKYAEQAMSRELEREVNERNNRNSLTSKVNFVQDLQISQSPNVSIRRTRTETSRFVSRAQSSPLNISIVEHISKTTKPDAGYDRRCRNPSLDSGIQTGSIRGATGGISKEDSQSSEAEDDHQLTLDITSRTTKLTSRRTVQTRKYTRTRTSSGKILGRKPFLPDESRKIFQFLIQKNLLDGMTGKLVYQLMEKSKLWGRSADSLQTHVKNMLRSEDKLKEILSPDQFKEVQTAREKKLANPHFQVLTRNKIMSLLNS